MKRKPVKRQWADAMEKVESEPGCRCCGATDFVDAAHIVPRRYDEEREGPKGGKYLYVHPDNVIPLCNAFSSGDHHGQYDAHRLDLLPFLTDAEFLHAVGVLGYERALKRVSSNA